MKTIALVPAKALAAAKTRLSPAMGQAGRAALSLDMLRHVLRAALQVPGVSQCGLVSADDQALAIATDLGALPLREPPSTGAGHGTGSLNRALDLGRDWALKSGADALLVVLSDLPLLRTEDLAEVVRVGVQTEVVIAPSTDGGTNVLLLHPPAAIPFRFGRDSARYHRFEADKRGLGVAIVERDTLRFDVDTPADLAAYRSSQGPLALVRP